MAADVKLKYGTTAQVITITLASLVTAAARSCLAIDNTTNLFLDALVQLQIKSPASATAATGYISVYAYGTVDGGTTYPEGCGTDVGVTLTAPNNLRLIGTINMVANATTYKSMPMSVAQAFGGVLPAKWGICVVNNSGGTLDSTGGNHVVQYQGVLGQTV